MIEHAISALSPLDGRYAAKLATLRPLMSEQGFMHRRVQVEITWVAGFGRKWLGRVKAVQFNRPHFFGEFDPAVFKR